MWQKWNFLKIDEYWKSRTLTWCSGAALLDLAQGESLQNTMKSKDYQGSLKRNVLPSVRKLGLRHKIWVMQEENDPKHTAMSMQEWLRGKHWSILKWPSMSTDLNPIEHLWKGLKHATWKKHPSNHEGKIPTERTRSLILQLQESFDCRDHLKHHLVVQQNIVPFIFVIILLKQSWKAMSGFNLLIFIYFLFIITSVKLNWHLWLL